jgi:putative ABC transport system permease protein
VTKLGLVGAGFRRHRLRLVLTGLSIAVAFLLFCLLSAVHKSFTAGVAVAGRDRLMTRNRVSIIQSLPASYESDIEHLPGVVDATPMSWFGGIYQDPKNFFPQFPVKPDEYVRMYPEIKLPKEQLDAWMKTRTGAVAGRSIAERFHWKIGDRIPIQATVWRPKTGGSTWEFELVGIYDGAKQETDTTQFLFREDYFDENRIYGKGTIGWYAVRVADPARAAAVAQAIDKRFENSPYEAKTEAEGAMAQGFADQVGNIGLMVSAIMAAVFFSILLVAGNTMAQSVRERTAELGVLKAVGFTGGQVLAIVLAESLLLACIGGGLGLLLGWVMVPGIGKLLRNFLPVFFMPARDLAIGAALVLVLGSLAGLLPALQAMRLRTVEALRRGG